MDDWLKTARTRKTEQEIIMAGGSLLDESGDKNFNWNEHEEESGVSSNSDSSSEGSSAKSSGGSSDSDDGQKHIKKKRKATTKVTPGKRSDGDRTMDEEKEEYDPSYQLGAVT